MSSRKWEFTHKCSEERCKHTPDTQCATVCVQMYTNVYTDFYDIFHLCVEFSMLTSVNQGYITTNMYECTKHEDANEIRNALASWLNNGLRVITKRFNGLMSATEFSAEEVLLRFSAVKIPHLPNVYFRHDVPCEDVWQFYYRDALPVNMSFLEKSTYDMAQRLRLGFRPSPNAFKQHKAHVVTGKRISLEYDHHCIHFRECTGDRLYMLLKRAELFYSQ